MSAITGTTVDTTQPPLAPADNPGMRTTPAEHVLFLAALRFQSAPWRARRQIRADLADGIDLLRFFPPRAQA